MRNEGETENDRFDAPRDTKKEEWFVTAQIPPTEFAYSPKLKKEKDIESQGAVWQRVVRCLFLSECFVFLFLEADEDKVLTDEKGALDEHTVGGEEGEHLVLTYCGELAF